jgi:hypothetical protein
MQGLAVLAILTWTGYRAVTQVLSNQVRLGVAPTPARPPQSQLRRR